MTGLQRYLLRRVGLFVLSLWAILTLMFMLFYLLPGDPTAMFVDVNFSPEMIERQKELWGLNDPVLLRYAYYLKNMLTFDFGQSFFQVVPVGSIIGGKLLNTFLLVVPPLIVSIAAGAFIGAMAGWYRGGLFERSAVAVSLVMHSVPSFFVGILALTIFSYQLRWLPTGGMVTRAGPEQFWEIVFSQQYWIHLLLPGLVLVSREITGPILLLRSSLLEVKGEDFLDILKSKGLPQRRIIWHAVRNALLPLASYVAVMAGLLFQGQVLLEIVFSWPGIGRELVQALGNLDYPVAQAILFVMALSTLILNLLADVLNGAIDPRVVYD